MGWRICVHEKEFQAFEALLETESAALEKRLLHDKNSGYFRFSLKNRRKKTPTESGFSHFSYSGSIIRRC